MNPIDPEKTAMARAEDLRVKRQELMRLSPQKALDQILESPQAVALVHSFAEEDFYLLVNDIGPDDSLPLLGMASNRQWNYILDIESWSKDRLDIKALTAWMNRLLTADSRRLIRWCFEENMETVRLYLFRTIDIHIREYDQAPSDLGDGFFSDDDTYYVRIREEGDPGDETGREKALKYKFLSEFLGRLSVYDHVRYQNLLMESAAVLPAESEEELFRLRNVHLAEKGFLPSHEAVGIYQGLKVTELHRQGIKHLRKSTSSITMLPVPLSSANLLNDESLFARSLAQIQDAGVIMELQAEFAGLSNQVISADGVRIHDRQVLQAVVKKVSDYLDLGLELILEGKTTPESSATLIEKYPLINIFRVGYGAVLELKWRAQKWQKDSWFTRTGLPLSFWGEKWLGLLGGLLIDKPKYFTNHADGVLYREFESHADILHTRDNLTEIIRADNLLSLMDIRIKSMTVYRYLSFHNLILTLWANDFLAMPPQAEEPIPIPMGTFKKLHERLWKGGIPPRKIRDDIKAHFLDVLSRRSGLKNYEITEQLGAVLEGLFTDIEMELGEVPGKGLDPRFIQLFLIRNSGKTTSTDEKS
ncbi:MAG: hypothetical protein HKM93_05330 [Desulfobacteraceae bacterium]|nr:hypothetical protein [Desulfobacteraceae bacterium]